MLVSVLALVFTIYVIYLEQRLSLTIEPSDYITPKATVGDSYVQLYVKGMVPETGQSFVDQKTVGFTKQKIHIEVSLSFCLLCHLSTLVTLPPPPPPPPPPSPSTSPSPS